MKSTKVHKFEVSRLKLQGRVPSTWAFELHTSRRNALRRHYEHGCAVPNKANWRARTLALLGAIVQNKANFGESQVQSGKCQGNRAQGQVVRVFPLQTSDLAVPARDGPPCGVSTNKANFASGDGTPKRDPLRLGTHARPTRAAVQNEANLRGAALSRKCWEKKWL